MTSGSNNNHHQIVDLDDESIIGSFKQHRNRWEQQDSENHNAATGNRAAPLDRNTSSGSAKKSLIRRERLHINHDDDESLASFRSNRSRWETESSSQHKKAAASSQKSNISALSSASINRKKVNTKSLKEILAEQQQKERQSMGMNEDDNVDNEEHHKNDKLSGSHNDNGSSTTINNNRSKLKKQSLQEILAQQQKKERQSLGIVEDPAVGNAGNHRSSSNNINHSKSSSTKHASNPRPPAPTKSHSCLQVTTTTKTNTAVAASDVAPTPRSRFEFDEEEAMCGDRFGSNRDRWETVSNKKTPSGILPSTPQEHHLQKQQRLIRLSSVKKERLVDTVDYGDSTPSGDLPRLQLGFESKEPPSAANDNNSNKDEDDQSKSTTRSGTSESARLFDARLQKHLQAMDDIIAGVGESNDDDEDENESEIQQNEEKNQTFTDDKVFPTLEQPAPPQPHPTPPQPMDQRVSSVETTETKQQARERRLRELRLEEERRQAELRALEEEERLEREEAEAQAKAEAEAAKKEEEEERLRQEQQQDEERTPSTAEEDEAKLLEELRVAEEARLALEAKLKAIQASKTTATKTQQDDANEDDVDGTNEVIHKDVEEEEDKSIYFDEHEDTLESFSKNDQQSLPKPSWAIGKHSFGRHEQDAFQGSSGSMFLQSNNHMNEDDGFGNDNNANDHDDEGFTLETPDWLNSESVAEIDSIAHDTTYRRDMDVSFASTSKFDKDFSHHLIPTPRDHDDDDNDVNVSHNLNNITDTTELHTNASVRTKHSTAGDSKMGYDRAFFMEEEQGDEDDDKVNDQTVNDDDDNDVDDQHDDFNSISKELAKLNTLLNDLEDEDNKEDESKSKEDSKKAKHPKKDNDDFDQLWETTEGEGDPAVKESDDKEHVEKEVPKKTKTATNNAHEMMQVNNDHDHHHILSQDYYDNYKRPSPISSDIVFNPKDDDDEQSMLSAFTRSTIGEESFYGRQSFHHLGRGQGTSKLMPSSAATMQTIDGSQTKDDDNIPNSNVAQNDKHTNQDDDNDDDETEEKANLANPAIMMEDTTEKMPTTQVGDVDDDDDDNNNKETATKNQDVSGGDNGDGLNDDDDDYDDFDEDKLMDGTVPPPPPRTSTAGKKKKKNKQNEEPMPEETKEEANEDEDEDAETTKISISSLPDDEKLADDGHQNGANSVVANDKPQPKSDGTMERFWDAATSLATAGEETSAAHKQPPPPTFRKFCITPGKDYCDEDQAECWTALPRELECSHFPETPTAPMAPSPAELDGELYDPKTYLAPGSEPSMIHGSRSGTTGRRRSSTTQGQQTRSQNETRLDTRKEEKKKDEEHLFSTTFDLPAPYPAQRLVSDATQRLSNVSSSGVGKSKNGAAKKGLTLDITKEDEHSPNAKHSPYHWLSLSAKSKSKSFGGGSMGTPTNLRSGTILVRTSLKSIITKKWKEAFWVQQDTSLVIFKSSEDYLKWLEREASGATHGTGYDLKFRIDFHDELVGNKHMRGFKMTDMKHKAYVKNGPIMYNFKLEKWTDVGPSIVAAFASEDLEEVKSLRQAIDYSLRQCPHDGLKSIADLLPVGSQHEYPQQHTQSLSNPTSSSTLVNQTNNNSN